MPASIRLHGPVKCETGPFRVAVFTSQNDNSVGEILPWSSGNPFNDSCGDPALEADFYTSSSLVNLHHLRFTHNVAGLSFYTGIGHVASHIQFVRCSYPMRVYYADVSLRNALIFNCQTAFNGSPSSTSRVEHLTAHNVVTLRSTDNTAYFTNSLLVAVTNFNGYVIGSNNQTPSTDAGVFATVGAAEHYLATDTYRGQGTPNVNQLLATELRRKTTRAPSVQTNGYILGNIAINPAVARDAGPNFDLGWHYDPLDIIFGSIAISNATVTLNPGSVLGIIGPPGSYGLLLMDGAKLIGDGSPTNLARIVRYNTVQEQANTNWCRYDTPTLYTPWWEPTARPEAVLRFTEWSSLGSDCEHVHAPWGAMSPITFIDSQLHAGKFWSESAGVMFTNCLFNRLDLSLYQLYELNNCSVRNNLFFGGQCYFGQFIPGGVWTFKDNAFDRTALTQDGDTDNAYNAYVTNYARLAPNAASDLIVSNFTYETGPLSPLYQPTTSPVINAGSQSAANSGLFHYCSTPSQAKEQNTTVDIGIHWLVMTGQGLPEDTDSDLAFDYQEDLNGNGAQDAGEFSYTQADLNTDADPLTNVQEASLGTSPVRVDTDGDGIPDGDEDYDADLLSNSGELITYQSDPKIWNSKLASVSDATYFHGAPVGISGNPTYIQVPPTFPPPDNIRWVLINAPANSVWTMYYSNQDRPVGKRLQPFDVGNTPTTTEFQNIDPTPGSGIFIAGVSTNGAQKADNDADGLDNGWEHIGNSSGVDTADTDGDDYSDGPLKPGALAPSGLPWRGANDVFPRDPAYALDTDGDGMPDERVPNNKASTTVPALVEDTDDDNDGIPDTLETPAGSKDPNVLPEPRFYVDVAPVFPSTQMRDGSKALPFDNIQQAIDLCPTGANNYSVVQVERGFHCGTGNRNLNFGGRNIILKALRGPEETFIDLGAVTECDGSSICTAANPGDRAFTFNTGEGSSARVIGFTIRNSPAPAVLCNGASPVFISCVLSNNATGAGAGNGGAFNLTASSVIILNCRILNNGNSSSLGGGFYCSGTSNPKISHSTFKDNTRSSGQGQLHLLNSSQLQIYNSTIWSAITETEIKTTSPASVKADFCNVKGGYTGRLMRNSDPLMQNDSRLVRTSGSVDRGSTNGIVGYELLFSRYDTDGEARVQVEPFNPLFTADIGADEFVFRLQPAGVLEDKTFYGRNGGIVDCNDSVVASEVDEASGVAFLGNDASGRAVIAVIDDEREEDFLIYRLNTYGDAIDTGVTPNPASISTLNFIHANYPAQDQVLDLEGITYDSVNHKIYATASNTKKRAYRGVENKLIDPLTFSPTNDYDRRRNIFLEFTVDPATFAVTSKQWFEPNVIDPILDPNGNIYFNPGNTYFNPDKGLIRRIRASLNGAPAPNKFQAQSLGTSVLIAWNTLNKFGTPVNGTAYALNATIPGGGTSLGTFGIPTYTYNHTPLSPDTFYHYKMWAVASGNVYTEFMTASNRTRTYPTLYINEFVAESPGAEDWIEIYNPLDVNVGLSGYKITYTDKDGVTTEHNFDTSPPTVNAGSRLQLFADETTGGIHLNFKLRASGGRMKFTTSTGQIFDDWVYPGLQRDNMSEGRAWDGGPSGRKPAPDAANQLREAVKFLATTHLRVPTTPGTANHGTERNTFIAAAAADNSRIFLRWRYCTDNPTTPTKIMQAAVWDTTPKENDNHAVNIEAVAYRSNSEMIIGLRSPLKDRTSGNALYFKVTDVNAFLPDAGWPNAALPAGIGGHLELNLNGQGFRSIEWCPQLAGGAGRYLIIGGPANGGPLEKELVGEKFSLYAWDGIASTPDKLIDDLSPYTVRPEGVALITVNTETRVMFVEDRFLAPGYATRNLIHWPTSILPSTVQ